MKSRVYFSFTAHLKLGAKFSLEILALYREFIKYTDEKVHSHTQVIQNLHQDFPISETSHSFQLYLSKKQIKLKCNLKFTSSVALDTIQAFS